VTLLPFGVGQFQNGSSTLGTWLLGTELAAAITSGLMYLLIEALRRDDGKFSPERYTLARQFETAKLVSGISFYSLWAIGVAEANYDFVPTHLVGETAPSPTLPAHSDAAPATPARIDKAPEKQADPVRPPAAAPTAPTLAPTPAPTPALSPTLVPSSTPPAPTLVPAPHSAAPGTPGDGTTQDANP
jgi:hypothetical protein